MARWCDGASLIDGRMGTTVGMEGDGVGGDGRMGQRAGRTIQVLRYVDVSTTNTIISPEQQVRRCDGVADDE